MSTETQCCDVIESGRGEFQRCLEEGTVERPDYVGRWFCDEHDPVAVHARHVADREDKVENMRKARLRTEFSRTREILIGNIDRVINGAGDDTSDLTALTEAWDKFSDARDALEGMSVSSDAVGSKPN